MESTTNMKNRAISVKEEPGVASLIQNEYGMIDENPDLENFQLLPFPREDSMLQQCEYDQESEYNEVETVVECEDVKPNVNLLTVKKTDDYYSNYLQNSINSDCIETQNMIEIETAREKDFFGDTAEELNSNFDCKPNDDFKIIFECEDVKPKRDLFTVKKIDYDSQSHLWNVKDSDGGKPLNIIQVETAGEVQQEFFRDVAEESILNFDCEIVEKNKKRRITKKLNSEHNLETYIGVTQNDSIHKCELCYKKLSSKDSLNRHVNSIHNCITHSCVICGKTYTLKSNLKRHTDVAHNGVTYVCHLCGKKFSWKRYLKIHNDSVHKGITHACGICGKTFALKFKLKVHIDAVHSKIKHACDICGKKYSTKAYLKSHIDSVHNDIIYTCVICGKIFRQKRSIEDHIKNIHALQFIERLKINMLASVD